MLHLSRTIIVIGLRKAGKKGAWGDDEKRSMWFGKTQKRLYQQTQKTLFSSYHTILILIFLKFHRRCPSSFQSRLESTRRRAFLLSSVNRYVKLKKIPRRRWKNSIALLTNIEKKPLSFFRSVKDFNWVKLTISCKNCQKYLFDF